jgi:segregation and condensation protein A
MEYNFTINDFEGPLDLLLHLVRTKEMDLYAINIKELIDEYLVFINNVDKTDLDKSSSYLVMAAELIHIKSKMLINSSDEEEDSEYEINSPEELQNLLVEYAKIKGITSSLEDLRLKRSQIYEKEPMSYKALVPEIKYNKEQDVKELYNAFLAFIKRESFNKPLETRINNNEINIELCKASIRSILQKKKKVDFMSLLNDHSKDYEVATFVAVLDMSKKQEVLLEQKSNFKPILVEKR